MKILLYISILFLTTGFASKMKTEDKLWSQLSSDSLVKLPNNTTSFKKLSSDEQNIILRDAKRTLVSREDMLEYFDKLAHPNGICFKGVWQIYTQNIYSGYFKKGTRSSLIARISTALSGTTSDDNRAFGFAGKLFSSRSNQDSANFFLIDDLGGSDIKHFRDASLTNEPPTSFTLAILKNLPYALKISSAFNEADTDAGIRQLYEISQLNEDIEKTIITPKWMKIDTLKSMGIDAKDFRDELHIEDEKNWIFNISVANKEIKGIKNWQKIGTITLEKSLISSSCDHRLHFHHPRFRDDLNYGD